MSTIPVQEEKYQELYTRDHGVVKVDGISFQDGGLHIVKCPNGTFMHASGLAVQSEKELRKCIPQPFLDEALEWFRNRHLEPENKITPIGFHSDGYPVLPDGSLPEFDDLYAFFKPGPVLTAAIVALQRKRDEMEGKPARPTPPAPKAKAPAPAPKAKAGKKASSKTKPAAPEKKAEPPAMAANA